MKKHIFPLFLIAATLSSPVSAQAVEMTDSAASKPEVYFTSDISPEGLLEVYHALGVKPEGKTLIHTAGAYEDTAHLFEQPHGQDAFLESMAVAAKSVHDYFGGKVIYINVMNNLSVDCDCNGHPDTPRMKDVGILASLDPVALDKACLDMVFDLPSSEGDDHAPLIERINSRHGTHTVDHAARIGFGSLDYELVDISREATPENK